MIRWAGLTIAVAMIPLLGGCADNPPAVIENKSVPAAVETPEVRQAMAPERAVEADAGQMLQRGPNYIVQPGDTLYACLLYTSPSPRDGLLSRMPSSA